MSYAVGVQLVHHTGQLWEVVDDTLPGDGSWEDGMVALAGDYLLRCVSLPSNSHRFEWVGREMRVHRDYLHGNGWRPLSFPEPVVVARCVGCHGTREVRSGEVPSGELPMCEVCGAPMYAETARSESSIPEPQAALRAFVEESNRIEGIFEVQEEEVAAHRTFVALPHLTVEDVAEFVRLVAGAKLRDREGMNVRVGGHIPPRGGSHIRVGLADLLLEINGCTLTPYEGHVEYERLHPFMDGNGRSGRAIWLWQMHPSEYGFDLPFLHSFYYQTLDASRKPEPEGVEAPKPEGSSVRLGGERSERK